MDATSKTIYQEITTKLQTAPKSILERVLGYMDRLLEENSESNVYEQNLNYQLTTQQKRELDEMENLSDKDFISSEEFHKSIKEKYGI